MPVDRIRWLALVRVVIAGLAVAAASAPASGTSPSSAFQSSKPLRIVSAAAPGTPGDVIARIVSEPLAAELGQPVVVENRAGATNTIGLAVVAKSDPDGHTLGILGMPSTIAPYLIANMPYDTVRDLAPVRQVSSQPNILVVRGGSPHARVADLVAAARTQPGRLNFASGGNGTPAHVVGELFRLRAGIALQHVPYKGVVAGVTAVLAGEVDMMFAAANAVTGHVRSGKLRSLASTAASPLASQLGVPTLAELGYFDGEVRDWHGVVVPSTTPSPTIDRLAEALNRVLSLQRVREQLAGAGIDVASASGPREFGELIRSELERWGKVVRDAGIRGD